MFDVAPTVILHSNAQFMWSPRTLKSYVKYREPFFSKTAEVLYALATAFIGKQLSLLLKKTSLFSVFWEDKF